MKAFVRREAFLPGFFALVWVVAAFPHVVFAAGVTCTGDCDASRRVTVDEILKMVNIALGNASVSECAAGDANNDGKITVDEILTAVDNALNGCPPASPPSHTPTATSTPTPTHSVVTLRVGSATGAAGQPVSFSVTISTAGNQVLATQNVISFDPNAQIAADNSGNPDCTSLTAEVFARVFLPPGCTPGSDCSAMRATFAAQSPVADGAILYTCTVQIGLNPTPPSTFPLHCWGATEPCPYPTPPSSPCAPEWADPSTTEFPADCADGHIVVSAPPSGALRQP